jgi:hypothetical protein
MTRYEKEVFRCLAGTDASAPFANKVWTRRRPLIVDLRKGDRELTVAFGKQQGVVGRIDNSGQGRATFPAIQSIAFESAGVDIGISATTEVQLRIAPRA